MDKEIIRYLNDHLAGSSAAFPLIQELSESQDEHGARDFFLHLKKEVGADRSMLEDLLEKIGHDPGVLHQIAGGVASRVAGVKLRWERIEPGEPGLLEALEMLAVGVQGKRLLWASLMEIAGWFPEWIGIDFEELELRATRQRDGIEFWRLQAAASILVDGERRTGIKEE